MNLPKELIQIAKKLDSIGAKAIVVGGAIRDSILNLDIKDIDIEVYNIASYEKLAKILSQFGKPNLVGKSFGVIKLKSDNLEYDFSLPRTEQKIDKGHRGFSVKLDSKLEFTKASLRRDFTINAMGYDILQKTLLDPHGGKKDLLTKTLQIVDKNSFQEDPLRVYRAVQFSARFELKLSDDTFNLCKVMVDRGDLEELPKERVFQEIKKLLLKAKKPSIGLELLRELGVLKYFPELKALIGTPQDPYWHKEGDVWVHTLMVVDEMAKLKSGDERVDLIRMLSALCHDFGKPKTTKTIDGKIRAFNHDKEGVEPTISFLKRLTDDKKLIDSVAKFVYYHLRVAQLYSSGAKAAAIRRLRAKIDIKELELLARADYFGRISKEKEENFKAGEWILNRAKELNILNAPPKPLINGKDLITLGLKPSPKFKEILNTTYNAQLDGKISTKKEALDYLKSFL
jgi:tRNA nucleotidyltransferase (CCA-adding enzyme)